MKRSNAFTLPVNQSRLNSKQNSTGHHRFIKHPQHSPADVKGAEPLQKIEAALSLLVEEFSVLSPVQFIVDVHPQISVVLQQCPGYAPGLKLESLSWFSSDPPPALWFLLC